MNKDVIIKEAKKIIRNYLPEDYKILIFGSWAKGNSLETSDIDIGILGKKEVSWHLMAKILQEIENIPTLRSIDVVDLNSVEKGFKNKVLEYAKVL